MHKVHLSLPVTDIEKTSEFYQVLFQSPPVKSKGDYVKFLPTDLGLNISFTQTTDSAIATHHHHLGIELSSPTALQQAHERLSHAGLVSDNRETSICCYANQDKFHVTDPDGYEWELYYLISDTHEKHSPATQCCSAKDNATTLATSCCG